MPDTNCLSLSGGVPVSKIALGTMYFGSRITREQSECLLDTFVSLGGNQIDTGRCYADWIPGGAGASERAVGKWLSGRKRESVFLGTKGGIKPRSSMVWVSAPHRTGEIPPSFVWTVASIRLTKDCRYRFTVIPPRQRGIFLCI